MGPRLLANMLDATPVHLSNHQVDEALYPAVQQAIVPTWKRSLQRQEHVDSSFLFKAVKAWWRRKKRNWFTKKFKVKSQVHLQRKLPHSPCIVRVMWASNEFAPAKIKKKKPTFIQKGRRSRGMGRDDTGARHGVCSPELVKATYKSFTDSLSEAQQLAFKYKEFTRWLHLQRADDVTRFLWRSDVSQLSLDEICSLGKALQSAQATWMPGPYHPKVLRGMTALDYAVPRDLRHALMNTQLFARNLAAFGFRCQATAFIWI